MGRMRSMPRQKSPISNDEECDIEHLLNETEIFDFGVSDYSLYLPNPGEQSSSEDHTKKFENHSFDCSIQDKKGLVNVFNLSLCRLL